MFPLSLSYNLPTNKQSTLKTFLPVGLKNLNALKKKTHKNMKFRQIQNICYTSKVRDFNIHIYIYVYIFFHVLLLKDLVYPENEAKDRQNFLSLVYGLKNSMQKEYIHQAQVSIVNTFFSTYLKLISLFPNGNTLV